MKDLHNAITEAATTLSELQNTTVSAKLKEVADLLSSLPVHVYCWVPLQVKDPYCADAIHFLGWDTCGGSEDFGLCYRRGEGGVPRRLHEAQLSIRIAAVAALDDLLIRYYEALTAKISETSRAMNLKM